MRTAEGKENCLLRGTKVLTDKGEVNIEDVTLDHKLWDGVEWISHAGSVCRGVQPVMQYAGLIATPDHKVMTDDGWKTIEEAARLRLGIVVTGFGERAIRFAPNHFESYIRFCGSPSCRGHVHEMREISYGFVSQHSEKAKNESLPTLQWKKIHQCSKMALSKMSSAAIQVPEFALQILRKIWGARHSIQIQFSQRSGKLGLEQSGGSGPFNAIGQNRQQWSLRTGKSSLGKRCDEYEQHSQEQGCEKEVRFISRGISSSEVCGFHLESAYLHGNDRSSDCRTVDTAFVKAEGEVWDILNAGPLQRFTANGRLVHNCLILDHSDTTIKLGFVTDIHHEALDSGEKRTASKYEKKEALPKPCPKCTYVKPPKVRDCPACGFKAEYVSKIETEEGELLEITANKKQNALDWTSGAKSIFYAELLGHALIKGYKSGWAYHAYRQRFGVGPASKPAPISPSIATASWIKHYNITKAKQREKNELRNANQSSQRAVA